VSLAVQEVRLASLKFGSQADVAALDPQMSQKFGPCIACALRALPAGGSLVRGRRRESERASQAAAVGRK